ncbi:hypothetical protein RRF57_005884 [Xylaria bambusicola]|uniref:Uncharacterized protein n=1 Tax=Xylaria bambusicola TaxID=326684 RepID=A0AAN7UYM7_9PEZI
MPLQETQGAALDFDSFKRAALLTVFQAGGVLGTRELDWYWREDAAFFVGLLSLGCSAAFRSR